MRLFPGRKIGLRTALVAIVVGGIVLSAAALHLVWWRTATSVSRELVGTLEAQITQAVRREWWAVVGEVERLSQGMRDLLGRDRERPAARPDHAGSEPALADPLLAPPGAAGGRRDRAAEPGRREPAPSARRPGRHESRVWALLPGPMAASPVAPPSPAPAPAFRPRRALARRRPSLGQPTLGRRAAHARRCRPSGRLRRQDRPGHPGRDDRL